MNEDVKQEIVSVLKDFFKGVLRDTIMIIIFFTMLTLIIGDPAENFDLKDDFLIEKAVECIAGFIFLRVIFTALNVILGYRRKKQMVNSPQEEKLESLNTDYAENLKHYKDVFKLGSPMITKYVNDPTENSMDENVLVAALAHLIRKGKIRIDGSKLVVVNHDVSLECEKYLLSKIRDGKFYMGTESSFYSTLSTYVARDAVDRMKLLEKVKPKSKWRGKLIVFGIILCVILAAFSGEESLAYDIFGCMATFLILYGLSYASSLSKLETTKRGKEINKKIEGLKKYLLKNYEVLSKNNDPEFEAPYILHMIAFGYHPKMVELYMKYVDITPEIE